MKIDLIVNSTHYNKVRLFRTDLVYILIDGRIVKTGRQRLVCEIEKYGYENQIIS